MPETKVSQGTLCRSCDWESAQPDELQRLDAAHHVKENPGHTAIVVFITEEIYR